VQGRQQRIVRGHVKIPHQHGRQLFGRKKLMGQGSGVFLFRLGKTEMALVHHKSAADVKFAPEDGAGFHMSWIFHNDGIGNMEDFHFFNGPAGNQGVAVGFCTAYIDGTTENTMPAQQSGHFFCLRGIGRCFAKTAYLVQTAEIGTDLLNNSGHGGRIDTFRQLIQMILVPGAVLDIERHNTNVHKVSP